VARDHALRPDGEAEKFDGAMRAKQHAHGEPCRAVAVNGGKDDEKRQF
jgi:hypothetical protein